MKARESQNNRQKGEGVSMSEERRVRINFGPTFCGVESCPRCFADEVDGDIVPSISLERASEKYREDVRLAQKKLEKKVKREAVNRRRREQRAARRAAEKEQRETQRIVDSFNDETMDSMRSFRFDALMSKPRNVEEVDATTDGMDVFDLFGIDVMENATTMKKERK